MRIWFGSKVDEEFMKSFGDDWPSPEQSAIEAARGGNIEPLRKLFPQHAEFIHLPKKETRGGDRRSAEARSLTEEKRQRVEGNAYAYHRMMNIRAKWGLGKIVSSSEIRRMAVCWCTFGLTEEDIHHAEEELAEALAHPRVSDVLKEKWCFK